MAANPEQSPKSWDGTLPGYERLMEHDPAVVKNAEYTAERIPELVSLQRFAEAQIKVLTEELATAQPEQVEVIQDKIRLHEQACERAQLIINELLDSYGAAQDNEGRMYH